MEAVVRIYQRIAGEMRKPGLFLRLPRRTFARGL